MIELTTACRTERHEICGGYQCACPCHSPAPVDLAKNLREALAAAAKAKRNRRGKRPPPPIVGVRAARRQEKR